MFLPSVVVSGVAVVVSGSSGSSVVSCSSGSVVVSGSSGSVVVSGSGSSVVAVVVVSGSGSVVVVVLGVVGLQLSTSSSFSHLFKILNFNLIYCVKYA
jgi:hypothetical protein